MIYLVELNGDLIRLKKGISKGELISILGEPYKIEDCKNPMNEKLIFRINNGRSFYSALVTKEKLVYVV